MARTPVHLLPPPRKGCKILGVVPPGHEVRIVTGHHGRTLILAVPSEPPPLSGRIGKAAGVLRLIP